MDEVWKSIPGYDGIYEASSLGRIRSVDGKITQSIRHGTRRWKQRIIKQKCYMNTKGRSDARVTLYKDKRQSTHLVSRLVALAFLGDSRGMTVNHIDGNHLNNKVENLEYLSHRENVLHGFRNGLYSNAIPVTLIDVKTGERIQFYSLSEAARSTGRSIGYLSKRIDDGAAIITKNGAMFVSVK